MGNEWLPKALVYKLRAIKLYAFAGCLLCVLISGIPFYLGISSLLAWHRSFSWMAVPMKIETIEIPAHEETEKCHYSYTIDSKIHHGQRAMLFDVAGTSERAELFRQLRACLASNEPFVGLVNPEKPDQAVLIRGNRLPMFIAVGIGCFLLLLALFVAAVTIRRFRGKSSLYSI